MHTATPLGGLENHCGLHLESPEKDANSKAFQVDSDQSLPVLAVQRILKSA